MVLKVLIVEDEEIIRIGIEKTTDWKSLGCQVIGTAKDGADGLNKIKSLKPDVVLTDIKMPIMNGLEMIRKASEECEFQSIVLTSYSEFELAKKAIFVGAIGYLLKPIDKDELAEVIEKVRKKLDTKPGWDMYEKAVRFGDVYAQKTCEIIMERYNQKLSVNDVADEMGISVSFLSRKLRMIFDNTFVDLLNLYRVEKAKEMLKNGTMRISEISDSVGFSEYKYFGSVFKKYVGMGPTEYKREVLNESSSNVWS